MPSKSGDLPVIASLGEPPFPTGHEHHCILKMLPSLESSQFQKIPLLRPDALVLDRPPTSEEQVLLESWLGRTLEPSGFPVFYPTTALPAVPPLARLGAIQLLPLRNFDETLARAITHRNRRDSSTRLLGWATLICLLLLGYLSLRGAKAFLSLLPQEARVMAFLDKDPPQVELRLAGPLERLQQRKKELDSIVYGIEFVLLPWDLSHLLNSRREECSSYLELTQRLLQAPSHTTLKTTEELELFQAQWLGLEARFPQSWQRTEAYLYWQQRQQALDEYLAFFARFKQDYQNRMEKLRALSSMASADPELDLALMEWLGDTQKTLSTPWQQGSYFLSQTNLAVVLEMRLNIHDQQRDLQMLRDWVQWLFRLNRQLSSRVLLKEELAPPPQGSATTSPLSRFTPEQKLFLKQLSLLPFQMISKSFAFQAEATLGKDWQNLPDSIKLHPHLLHLGNILKSLATLQKEDPIP